MGPGHSMTQEIQYGLAFLFSPDEETRELMLPAVDLFLRSLEEADRLAAGTLGLEMTYKRALKEMGQDAFRYQISITLSWPRQILLGAWPEAEILRQWMDQARRDLVEAARSESCDVAALAQRWHAKAAQDGLADALLYLPPAPERVSPLLEDLARAMESLGGTESVELTSEFISPA